MYNAWKLSIDDLGFTLTMWDVKEEKQKIEKWNNQGFTLTMWDVKLAQYKFGIVTQIMFYLNYVGCKVRRISCFRQLLIRFTLTMWDVKVCTQSTNKFVQNGFTLTMWDVKFDFLLLFLLPKT